MPQEDGIDRDGTDKGTAMTRYGEVCLLCPCFEASSHPGRGDIFLCSADVFHFLIDAENWERHEVPDGCHCILETLVLNEENHCEELKS